MAASYVLGIDVGTTALKAIALERDRGNVAQVERTHELLSPHSGWAEEDPERWWTTSIEAIRELLTTIPAEEIMAIGVSGMVPAMVLLDANGQPVRASIQQNDARSISRSTNYTLMLTWMSFSQSREAYPTSRISIRAGTG